ncbi:hypothetical protein ACFQ1E_17515 [Sphingomonas canadensis]|uniref:Uncharacterized protein n=1 Tax=Sphingomonas canadensis TaxID=1219257 RepID=A0ABW3HBT5_9SPHN|nr:hypothetical protein [Sphingomonas canadensis]MCW3837846.1 hypothetical protein [Sphingomonas canadensis]
MPEVTILPPEQHMPPELRGPLLTFDHGGRQHILLPDSADPELHRPWPLGEGLSLGWMAVSADAVLLHLVAGGPATTTLTLPGVATALTLPGLRAFISRLQGIAAHMDAQP